MTDLSAEERARECLARAMEQHGGDARLSCAADIRADKGSEYWSVPIRALIAFEAATIERACQRIEAVVERGYPTPADKTDQCTHGMFGWEGCIACYDEQLLAEVAAIRQLHSSEGAGRGEDG